jgi:hypothetical protein
MQARAVTQDVRTLPPQESVVLHGVPRIPQAFGPEASSQRASFALATRKKARKRDETVRVSPAGFGQHESPICARPRRLAPAITASNFDLMVLRTSLDFRRSPSRSSIAESLVTRPSSLPPT